MAVPGPPVFAEETRDQILALLSKGAAGGLFFTTDDCQASYEELKSRGVEFATGADGAALRARRRVP